MTLLDRTSAIPMYYQLKVNLRERILSGEFTPGQQTPSEPQLAKLYGVSKMTVRQALAELVDEGLLERRVGVGTFVANGKVQRDLVGDYVTFFENRAGGHQPSSRLLNVEKLPANRKVQSKLKLRSGETVLQLDRLLLVDGESIAFQRVWISQEKFPQLLEEMQHCQSVIELLERKYQLSLAKTEQKIEAVKADERIAGLLGIEVGSPLLYTDRTLFLSSGEPIETSDTYYRSDRYAYHVTLYRRKSQ